MIESLAEGVVVVVVCTARTPPERLGQSIRLPPWTSEEGGGGGGGGGGWGGGGGDGGVFLLFCGGREIASERCERNRHL